MRLPALLAVLALSSTALANDAKIVFEPDAATPAPVKKKTATAIEFTDAEAGRIEGVIHLPPQIPISRSRHVEKELAKAGDHLMDAAERR